MDSISFVRREYPANGATNNSARVLSALKSPPQSPNQSKKPYVDLSIDCTSRLTSMVKLENLYCVKGFSIVGKIFHALGKDYVLVSFGL